MKLLLDTHILMWALADDPRLPAQATFLINDPGNELFCSVVSIWEIAIKHAKRPEKNDLTGEQMIRFCGENNIHQLPLYFRHISAYNSLRREENTPVHNDPFDKMMIVQAKAENMIFITHDGLLRYYNEPCILYV